MSTESTPALLKGAAGVDAVQTDGPAPAGPSARSPRARSTTAYLRYAAGKLAGAAVSLFAVLVTSFFLFRLIPGDPVKQMTGGRQVSNEQIAAMRKEFGLDLPLWQQFTEYCGKALTGDFGTSYQFRAPVMDKISEALPATLLLTGTAFVIYTAIGIWLGARSAWRNGSAGDRFHTAFALTLYSVPSFWLGLLLIITLSVGIGPIPGLFPTGGMESGSESGFAYVLDVAHHLVLPVITLVAVEYARTLLVMRSSLLDEMGSDYLTTARAKGLRDDLVRQPARRPERDAAHGDAPLRQPGQHGGRRHPGGDGVLLARSGRPVLPGAERARSATGAGAVLHLRRRGDPHEHARRCDLSAPRSPGGPMTTTTDTAPTPGPRALTWARRRQAAGRFWRQYRAHRAGVAGLAVLALIALTALAAPLLVGADSQSVTTAPGSALESPSAEFPSARTSSAAVCSPSWCGGRGSR